MEDNEPPHEARDVDSVTFRCGKNIDIPKILQYFRENNDRITLSGDRFLLF
jgi:hypothetical protein